MKLKRRDRRRYKRYDMEVKINFYVDYDLETRVEFQIIDKREDQIARDKRVGLSKNFNAEGVRFSSDEKLKKGDRLFLEVYLPKRRRPIPMMGKVRWSRKIPLRHQEKYRYYTGVKLMSVENHPVAKSIHRDRKYNVPWSIVLESVFGGFNKAIHDK